MAKVVRWLFLIVGALLSVIVVRSLMIEMVSLLLVLLMSAVPVALPVMFTVSMAVGGAELSSFLAGQKEGADWAGCRGTFGPRWRCMRRLKASSDAPIRAEARG